MKRPSQEPTIDERGEESHPAFGMVQVTRVSQSPPGASLFDSEIRHSHYVLLRIKTADRKRDLNRDWIHSRRELVEVGMSESQWASLVSSFNTEGVPCTIRSTPEDHMVPEPPFSPRLALSTAETGNAAHRAFDRARAALELVEEKPTKANVRALRIALDQAAPNVEYAARSLTEHTENVVEKARADIEAMVAAKAKSLGLTPAQTAPLLAITEGDLS
jgi:hypothetical protein